MFAGDIDPMVEPLSKKINFEAVYTIIAQFPRSLPQTKLRILDPPSSRPHHSPRTGRLCTSDLASRSYPEHFNPLNRSSRNRDVHVPALADCLEISDE